MGSVFTMNGRSLFAGPIDADVAFPVANETVTFPTTPELTVVLGGLNEHTVLAGRVPQV
jgi:hypothetical protein